MALKSEEQLQYRNMFEHTLIKYKDLQLNQDIFGEGDWLSVIIVGAFD